MALLQCGSCRQKFRMQEFLTDRTYSCPKCRGRLELVDSGNPAARPSVADIPLEAKEAANDPARRLGRFVIAGELGRGAMGTVHRAWDTRLGRWVAIKILRPGAAESEDLERFRQEASVVARLAAEYDGQIHLLVTDVVMPRMSGTELASELVLSRPGVRVLYTSGSVDWTGSKANPWGPKVAFLAKPFTPGELSHKVREILGAQARR